MAHKFISIRAVLSNLASTFPKDLWDEDTAIEWAAFALQSIGTYTQLEPKIAFVQLKNHRARLPQGLVKLEQVAFNAKRNVTEDSLAELKAELKIPTESYYEGFFTLTSRYHYVPMRKATSPFSLQKECEDCDKIYPASLEYTILPNGCIHTSVNKGDICIAYLQYPVDENGDFLIPDRVTVIRAITYYVSMKIWELRMNMKEEGAYNMFNAYLDLWTTLATRSVGELLMPDIDTMQNIKDMTDRFFPASNRYFSFFGNLASMESPSFGGRYNKSNSMLWYP